MVDVDWRCPACSATQADTFFWAGSTNRARATVKCVGCERVALIALSVVIRMDARMEVDDGEG